MAIKNFQGAFELQDQVEERITVASYMNREVISFKLTQSILEVMDIMITKGISSGFVIDGNMAVLGVISEGDCIKKITASKYYNMPMEDLSIQNYMTKEVISVHPNDNLMDVANKFLTAKKRRFPVIENQKLVGMISQKNVLIAAMNWSGNHWENNH
jgi:CBS domain-containing protein